ncbi:major capsid protein [Tistrella bauzanensis]|uniref:major capsid protein n=1 Tax=Tistrella TaxID=171436 RepID=UPI0031F6E3AC
MTGINIRTAGVVDPVLSTHARGYRNQAHVASALCPRVPVPSRSDKVIRYDKSDFRAISARRAPGGPTLRLQLGHASDTVTLDQDSVEIVVPKEHLQEAQRQPSLVRAMTNTSRVMKRLDLGLEIQVATMARAPATYSANNKITLTGNDRWTSGDSDPLDDVLAGQNAISRSIGQKGNVLLVGPTVLQALQKNSAIQSRFTYTTPGLITTTMLSTYFGVRVVEGGAVYLPEGALDTDPALPVWGDDAILAYVPEVPEAEQDMGEPAYGYIYELEGYPTVETPYYDDNRKSWMYPMTVERRPYIVGAEGGFLFAGAGAPAA